MSRTVDPIFKQNLLDQGLWDEYRRFYESEVAAGARPNAARKTAMEAFNAVLAGEKSVADLRTDQPAPTVMTTAPASAPDFTLLKRKKPARPMVEFRWVLRNMDEAEIDMASCPDYEAWKILRYCQENPAMFRDLLAEYERRGFSRDNGEDRRDAPLDGDDIIADIDKLQKAGVVK